MSKLLLVPSYYLNNYPRFKDMNYIDIALLIVVAVFAFFEIAVIIFSLHCCIKELFMCENEKNESKK